MKNFMEKFRNKTNAIGIAIKTKKDAAIANVKGNEPSSYVGLILVALIVVGVLVVAAKAFFPTLFDALTTKAEGLIGTEIPMETTAG